MYPFFIIGVYITAAYFIFFLVLLPAYSLCEKLAYHLYVESTDMQKNKISARLYIKSKRMHTWRHVNILLIEQS